MSEPTFIVVNTGEPEPEPVVEPVIIDTGLSDAERDELNRLRAERDARIEAEAAETRRIAEEALEAAKAAEALAIIEAIVPEPEPEPEIVVAPEPEPVLDLEPEIAPNREHPWWKQW